MERNRMRFEIRVSINVLIAFPFTCGEIARAFPSKIFKMIFSAGELLSRNHAEKDLTQRTRRTLQEKCTRIYFSNFLELNSA
jgi:hypothetical protein